VSSARHPIVIFGTWTRHRHASHWKSTYTTPDTVDASPDMKGSTMKRSTIQRRVLPLALAALAGTPIATTLTSTSASAAAAKAAKTQTFKGPVEYVDHGPVQVSIAVKNKKIVSVSVVNAPEQGRSVFIQSQAIPILKQETLRAQSANINEVSGATDTSSGYIASLQSAVKKARTVKAIK
jgi:uncharacterized protein with FMN-binding domain